MLLSLKVPLSVSMYSKLFCQWNKSFCPETQILSGLLDWNFNSDSRQSAALPHTDLKKEYQTTRLFSLNKLISMRRLDLIVETR